MNPPGGSDHHMNPTIIDGIPCYAPELAYENEGFPPEEFERVFRAEERNFWYRSRARILERLVSRYLGRGGGRFLEIGCGTGSVLQALSRIKTLEIVGAEVHLKGLHLARKRLPHLRFIQLDALRLPFEGQFRGVGMFDVLEHITEDNEVLRNSHRALEEGGYLFLTVPQHPSLWSANDEAAFHKRRYTREDLLEKVMRAGFTPQFVTSFVTCLLPPMWLSRKLKRVRHAATSYQAVMEELTLPRALNAAFDFVMRIDELFIAMGFSLMVGGSLAVVARK